jgi:hypothetical protein
MLFNTLGRFRYRAASLIKQSRGNFFSPPRRDPRPFFREGPGTPALRQRWQTIGESGGVFFKLQLVMFFEGIRSERELMRVAADCLSSVHWHLGYDLQTSFR